MTCATEGCRLPRQPGREHCASCLAEHIKADPTYGSRDAAFKRMWNQGICGDDIAEALGYKDRDVVYATRKRLGLPARKRHVRNVR